MSNYCKIKERYEGKFVAVYNEMVIDSDADYRKLKKRLNKINLDLNAIFKMYIQKGNDCLIESIYL